MFTEYIETDRKPDFKLNSIEPPSSEIIKQPYLKSSQEVYEISDREERFSPEDIIALVFLDVQVLSLENKSNYSQIGVYTQVIGFSDPAEKMNSSSFLFPLQPPEVGDLSVKVYLKLLEKLRVRTSKSSSAQFLKDSDRLVIDWLVD